jgi:hypothetical protein
MMTYPNHLTVIGAATFALTFAFALSGFGQQPGGASPQDAQRMMAQCAQVRQQVHQNPGAPPTGEMQQMLAQCDQMDRTNSQTGGNPGQQPPSR